MMGWNRTRTVAELHAARPPLAGTHVRAACTGRGDEGQREPPEMAAVARTYNMLPHGPLIPCTCTWTWGKLDQIQIAIEHPRLDVVRLIVIPRLQLPVVAHPTAYSDRSLPGRDECMVG
jgi:hypothetical protein